MVQPCLLPDVQSVRVGGCARVRASSYLRSRSIPASCIAQAVVLFRFDNKFSFIRFDCRTRTYEYSHAPSLI